MNQHERDRLAAAMNQLRPDWPTNSIRTLLDRAEIRDRPRRDVCVALAWVACESGTATPARVLEAGPWWRAAAADGTTTSNRDNPDASERCSTCSLSQMRCRQLWTDDHEFVPATRTRSWRSDPDRIKSVTDALRAEVQPTREVVEQPALSEHRTEKSAAARAAIQHPEEDAVTPNLSSTTDRSEVSS